MTEVIKIVLTGGPCAGKSTALHYLKNELLKIGIQVFTVEEKATILINEGITPKKIGIVDFQKKVFEQAYIEEMDITKKAQNLDCDKVVIIFDRGLLDGKAFIGEVEFERLAASFGLSEDVIRNSYDAVFHMMTAANGAEEYYNCINNSARSETPEQARENDLKILAAWTGNNHLRIIDNSTDFEGKKKRLLQEILAFLGIPEPLEIERKFLINYPDIKLLETLSLCKKIPITQIYISTPDEGNFRIRKRGIGKDALYIKTIKRKISDIKRIETETYITENEFFDYLRNKSSIIGTISKDRYCIVYKSFYYELDVYPFWNDVAILELELLSETQTYELPPFVKLIKEVSEDPEYRNFSLAQRYKI